MTTSPEGLYLITRLPSITKSALEMRESFRQWEATVQAWAERRGSQAVLSNARGRLRVLGLVSAPKEGKGFGRWEERSDRWEPSVANPIELRAMDQLAFTVGQLEGLPPSLNGVSVGIRIRNNAVYAAYRGLKVTAPVRRRVGYVWQAISEEEFEAGTALVSK